MWRCMTHDLFLLLLHLFDEYAPLLVLTSLVLEPDSNDSRAESSHLDQLFFHQCVRSWVGSVTGAQRVKLFLVQHGPDSCGLLVSLV